MAIEFACQKCGKTLRTGDETAGKQARCPECGAVQPIPAAGATPPPPPPDNPFAFIKSPASGESPNPYQSPASSSIPPRQNLGGTGRKPIVAARIDVGDILNRAYEIFKPQMGICIGVTVLALAINYAAQFAANIVTMAAGATNEPVIIIIAQLFSLVVNVAFQTWIGVGQSIFFLKIARGQNGVIQDLFSGGQRFLPVLGQSLLVGIAVFALIFVCAIPAIIVGVSMQDEQATVIAGAVCGVIAMAIIIPLVIKLSQAYLLVIDQEVPVMESFSKSWEVTRGNAGALILLYLALMGISLAGFIACCVGLIFAMPYVYLAYVLTFLTMTGQFNQPEA